MCAAMFQNSNSLPIALVQSLVVEVPGLKWGDDDDKNQMLGRALTYMVVYSTLGMILRWSYGVQLLASADEAEAADAAKLVGNGNGNTNGDTNGHSTYARYMEAAPDVLSPAPIDHSDPFLSPETQRTYAGNMSPPSGGRSPSPSLPLSGSATSAYTLQSRGRSRSVPRNNSVSSTRRPRIPSRADSGREFWGLPEQPRTRLVDLDEDSSESEALSDTEDEWGGAELPSLRRRRSPLPTGFRARLIRAKATFVWAWSAFLSFMTVPTWAALASIIIALIPPLQAGLGKLRPLTEAIKSAGQCSIPVTLVVLGAFFYTPPAAIHLALDDTDTDTDHDSDAGAKPRSIKEYFGRKLRTFKLKSAAMNKDPQYPGEGRTVLVACLARMVIVPLIFLPLIALLAWYDPFVAAEDPVFILCAVLLVSSPPALTLAQITQAASGDAFERLISKTISVSYAVLTPPLTLVYVVLALMIKNL